MVSDYYWKTARMASPPSFAEFVAERLEARGEAGEGADGNWRLMTINDQLVMDRCIRYEALNEDFGEVCRHLGIPWDGELPRAKSGLRRDVDLYTDRERDAVRRLARKEIELFGFEPPLRD